MDRGSRSQPITHDLYAASSQVQSVLLSRLVLAGRLIDDWVLNLISPGTITYTAYGCGGTPSKQATSNLESDEGRE